MLAKWQATWDIIIEPLFLEIVGYFALYTIFSIWFKKNAWKIILLLLVPNVLFEVLVWIIKRKKYKIRVNNFFKLFSSDAIFSCCYYN